MDFQSSFNVQKLQNKDTDLIIAGHYNLHVLMMSIIACMLQLPVIPAKLLT